MRRCMTTYVRPVRSVAPRASSVIFSALRDPDDVRPDDSISNVGVERPAHSEVASGAARSEAASGGARGEEIVVTS